MSEELSIKCPMCSYVFDITTEESINSLVNHKAKRYIINKLEETIKQLKEWYHETRQNQVQDVGNCSKDNTR